MFALCAQAQAHACGYPVLVHGCMPLLVPTGAPLSVVHVQRSGLHARCTKAIWDKVVQWPPTANLIWSQIYFCTFYPTPTSYNSCALTRSTKFPTHFSATSVNVSTAPPPPPQNLYV